MSRTAGLAATAPGAPAPAPPRGRGRPDARPRRRRSPGEPPLWFAAPAGAGLLVLLVYPTVALLAFALTESSLARPLREFTGFDNAVTAWQALAFRGSLVRSTVFALTGAFTQVVLGLAVALLLRARGRGLGVAGTLLLLPLVTPPVMVGVAWKLMLAPVGGALTGLWQALGVPGFNPLGSGGGAFTTLLVIDTWQWLPFVVLLVFAALLGVPDELLEAAQLDGAGWWRSFTAVVWPVITPTVLAVVLIKTVIGFKVFDLVVVVTEGGPGLSTVLAPFEIYRTALRGDFDVGVAAVETLVFAALVGALTTLLTVARSRAVQGEG